MLVWEDEIRSRFVKELVIWTQPSGPLFHWGWVWEWFCIFVGVLIFIFVSLSSTLSTIFLTQFPLLVLCESDTPNWQRASHTNDSIWRPHLLSNKCPCHWSWVPGCNTLNHIEFKFKAPNLKNFGCLCLCIQFSLKFPIYILSIQYQCLQKWFCLVSVIDCWQGTKKSPTWFYMSICPNPSPSVS